MKRIDDRIWMGAAAILALALLLHKRRFVAPCNSRRLLRDFGHWRHKKHLSDCFHTGIDFILPIGSPVYAAAPGTIEIAHDDRRGYGLRVVIQHDDGWRTIYAHLDSVSVTTGQRVAKGEQIALSGRSGHTRRKPQLHFEVRSPGYFAEDPWELLRW